MSMTISNPAVTPSSPAPETDTFGLSGVKVPADLEGLPELLAILPMWIQDAVLTVEAFEAIAIDVGRRLVIKHGSGYASFERIVTKDDIHYVIHRINGFREDNRTGIEKTFHRISAIRDRYGEIVGVTVRFGRFIYGAAEPLYPLLKTSHEGLMLIGRPGVGKTTILRDVARILAKEIGPNVAIVDSSNEIGGDGKIPHPGIGLARRLQVPNPSVQAKIMMQAIANHGPEVVIADEIGYHNDVGVVVTMARRGVRFIATAHGETLQDILDNPDLTPLLGGIDIANKRRLARPVFGAALEIRAKKQLYLHADLASSVDALLSDCKPQGEWIQGGPQHVALEDAGDAA